MAKQMPPAAKIYLQESAVLEEARDELARELDDLWTTIWEDATPQLEGLAQSYSRVVHLWSNSSEKGTYMISPGGKTKGKRSKGLSETSDKNASTLAIFIRDPRTSQTPGSYHLRLRLAQIAQSQIKRKSPTAPQKIEKLVYDEGLTGPVNWGSGALWSAEIKIAPDDLGETVTAVSETACKLFRVIVEFDKWIETQSPPHEREARR